jgi:hypothetical protein
VGDRLSIGTPMAPVEKHDDVSTSATIASTIA